MKKKKESEGLSKQIHSKAPLNSKCHFFLEIDLEILKSVLCKAFQKYLFYQKKKRLYQIILGSKPMRKKHFKIQLLFFVYPTVQSSSIISPFLLCL